MSSTKQEEHHYVYYLTIMKSLIFLEKWKQQQSLSEICPLQEFYLHFQTTEVWAELNKQR